MFFFKEPYEKFKRIVFPKERYQIQVGFKLHPLLINGQKSPNGCRESPEKEVGCKKTDPNQPTRSLEAQKKHSIKGP